MLVINLKKLKKYHVTCRYFTVMLLYIYIFPIKILKIKKKLKIPENHVKKFDPWEVQFYRSLEVPKLRRKWCFKIYSNGFM